jgi:uncharacterized protein YndB with AHSA1/START domain
MTIPADVSSRTLVITRTLNAPRELVFDVWTDPKHLVRWWGPNDFTLPHCEQDLRVGGAYRFCMRAPDGSDHWVRGEYHDIDRPERIVFSWKREEAGAIWCDNMVTVTFEAEGKETLLTLHHAVFETVQQCTEHSGGWNECMDRLVEHVNAIAWNA